MAQSDSTVQLDPGLVGLDPSLTVPADTGETIRRMLPKVVTLGAVALGLILAYNLPALNLADGTSLSLSEVSEKLTFSRPTSKGWVVPLTWFFAVFTFVATIFLPETERFARTVASSLGALGTLVLPAYVQLNQSSIDENADGLGAGLIAAAICFAIAVVTPWISLLWIDRRSPILERGWSRWLFVGPALLWILLLTVFPLVYALNTSRYGFRNGQVNRAVGWDNYKRAFADADWSYALGQAFYWAIMTAIGTLIVGLILTLLNNEFRISRAGLSGVLHFIPVVSVPAFVIGFLTNSLNDPLDFQLSITVFFAICVVAIEMVLGLLFALLMNREIRGRAILRAILILPLFAAPVGIGYLSRTIFYEGGGPMDRLVEMFGMDPPAWLSDPAWARYTTIIVDVWQWTPFVFVIALAGLQGMPHDILEASRVDGANAWQTFRSITLPLLAPILWLILLLRAIDAFKIFDSAFALTGGGPGRETEYYSMFNYRTARKFFDYGTAAVQAFILLLVVAIFVSVLWGRIRDIYEDERLEA